MLQELLVARPDDPLEFMTTFLKKPDINGKYLPVEESFNMVIVDLVPKVIIYGPPASGKNTIVSGCE